MQTEQQQHNVLLLKQWNQAPENRRTATLCTAVKPFTCLLNELLGYDLERTARVREPMREWCVTADSGHHRYMNAVHGFFADNKSRTSRKEPSKATSLYK